MRGRAWRAECSHHVRTTLWVLWLRPAGGCGESFLADVRCGVVELATGGYAWSGSRLPRKPSRRGWSCVEAAVDRARRPIRDPARWRDLRTVVVTLLFTDVEGSTRLRHELSDRHGRHNHLAARRRSLKPREPAARAADRGLSAQLRRHQKPSQGTPTARFLLSASRSPCVADARSPRPAACPPDR